MLIFIDGQRIEALRKTEEDVSRQDPPFRRVTGTGRERVGLGRFIEALPACPPTVRPTVSLGAVAQLGERRFCKPEVVGSIPISSIDADARCPLRSGEDRSGDRSVDPSRWWTSRVGL